MLGIPTNICAKNIVRTLSKSHLFNEVLIFCIDQESKKIHETELEKQNNEESRTENKI